MDTSGLGERRRPEKKPLSLSGLGSSLPTEDLPPFSKEKPNEIVGSRDGK